MKALRIIVYMVCLLFPLSCGEKESPDGPEVPPLVPEGEYVPVGKPDIKDDIRVKVLSGTASSWQQGENIEKSFDGSYETLYHSSWDNSAGGYFPVTLTYSFSKGTDIDYLVYHPRKSGSNGNFRETEIHYKIRGKEWSAAGKYDFKGSGHPSKVDFRTTLKDVESIRFTVWSGAGDGQGFASCSEMEFYRVNPDKFDPLSLFTDRACSALRPGVTDEDIRSCGSEFFRNIAAYMKAGRYPTEFRVQEYSAYPYPEVVAWDLKISPYSFMDGATGIFSPGGEDMVVLVDGLGNRQASVYVQNLDRPGGDGFHGRSFPLSDGVNQFKSMDKGLLYVVFQSDDYLTANPVKVHFAGGRVNGLFDLRRHKDTDWQRLLGAAEYSFFDVVGEYSHLTFPTSRFRAHTPDGAALVRVFDSFVRAEQELMGLYRYGRTFPNRMRFIVIYTSYMYATSYYTAYNDSTLPQLCDVLSLTTGSCWGPAHEVGHCNQTRPGLKWLGTTEVTNNIMSEYVQTTILRQPSRLQTEDMGEGLPNRYAKAWRDILAAGAPHSTEGDVFCKLVPFWQLQLYFGEVLGQTPELREDKGGFYPDVFEHVRTSPDLGTAGEQQTEFVLTCSKASGHNLLDFFTKWGFLTPVDASIDDYGSGRMTVTESRIEEIRQRVEALGLPKPDSPIEYITDNNKGLFKTRPEVIPGSVSVSSSGTVTLTDWKNVVVFEVRDADGGLVFASEGKLAPSSKAVFSVPGGWNPSYRLMAVSATGKRTDVTP